MGNVKQFRKLDARMTWKCMLNITVKCDIGPLNQAYSCKRTSTNIADSIPIKADQQKSYQLQVQRWMQTTLGSLAWH